MLTKHLKSVIIKLNERCLKIGGVVDEKKKKLSKKFIVPVVTFVILMQTLLIMINYLINSYQSYQDLEMKSKTILDTGIVLAVEPMWSLDDSGVVESAKGLLKDKEVCYVKYTYSDDKVVFEELKQGFKKEGLLIRKSDVMKDDKKLGSLEIALTDKYKLGLIIGNVYVSIIINLVTVFILYILITYLAKKLTGPLGILTRTAEELSKGNLTKEVNVVSNDEIGVLSNKFDIMRNELRKTVSSSIQLASTLAGSVENINKNMENIKTSIKDTTQATEDIAKSAGGQSLGIEEMLSITKANLESLNNISDSIAKTLELSDESLELAKEGNQKVINSVNKFEELNSFISNYTNIILELSEYSGNIISFTLIIRDIAEKTNLLALNASIEAARAGESGRGFAVVAEEIRKLAEQSNNSVSNIAQTVEKINSRMSASVEKLKDGQDISKTGLDISVEAGKSLDNILTSSEKISEHVEEVRKEVIAQREANKKVVEKLGKISASAEQTAAATKGTTATMIMQEQIIVDIAKDVEKLYSSSQELLEANKKFKV